MNTPPPIPGANTPQEPLDDGKGNLSPDVRKLVNENFEDLVWKDTPPLQLDAATEEELSKILFNAQPGAAEIIVPPLLSHSEAKAALTRLLLLQRVEELEKLLMSYDDMYQRLHKGEGLATPHTPFHDLAVKRLEALQAQLEKETQGVSDLIPCICDAVTVGGTPMPHYHDEATP